MLEFLEQRKKAIISTYTGEIIADEYNLKKYQNEIGVLDTDSLKEMKLKAKNDMIDLLEDNITGLFTFFAMIKPTNYEALIRLDNKNKWFFNYYPCEFENEEEFERITKLYRGVYDESSMILKLKEMILYLLDTNSDNGETLFDVAVFVKFKREDDILRDISKARSSKTRVVIRTTSSTDYCLVFEDIYIDRNIKTVESLNSKELRNGLERVLNQLVTKS